MSSTVEFKKICEHCGASFITRKSTTHYCSKRCAEHAYKQRKREEHVTSTQKAINDSSSMIEIPQRDYLSPTECANLLGLCRRTVYYYLSNNIIPCFQFKDRTRIRHADIETLFDNAVDYVKMEKKEAEPITEFYTTKEVLEKFSIGNSWLYKVTAKHNIPKTVSRGKTLWSKKYIDCIFGKPAEEVINKDDLYTVDEVCTKFGMKKEVLYRLVSELKITKQKSGTLSTISDRK